MAVTVEGVPESITQDRLIEWLAEIGIDGNKVRAVHIVRGAIIVEVKALDPEGKRFTADDEAAHHVVAVPVTGGGWE